MSEPMLEEQWSRLEFFMTHGGPIPLVPGDRKLAPMAIIPALSLRDCLPRGYLFHMCDQRIAGLRNK